MRLNLVTALFFPLLAACTDKATDSADLQGGDTCTAITSGTWTFTGPAWGMGDYPMLGDIALDAEACEFTFSDWDMNMDDLPSGGVLDGDRVQLDGLNSYWRSCIGTAADENTIGGTCEDDGAAFQIAYGDQTDSGM